MSSTPPVMPAWNARRVALATLVVLAVLLAFYLLIRFYIVVFILFVAIVIAVAIRPLVDWLYRRGLPRPLGVLLIYLLLLGLSVGFVLLLTPLLVDQVTTISARLPDYYRELIVSMFTSNSNLVQRLAMQLPGYQSLAAQAANGPAAATGGAGGPRLDTVGQVLDYVKAGVRGVFVGTSILVLAFYWVLEGQRALRSLFLRAPVERREMMFEIVSSIEDKVGAYVRGVVILSATVAVLAGAAYLIIGLPYALVLGLVAGVLEILPIVGPVIGAIPPVLLALSLEPSKVIWVVVAVVIIQQFEGNVLVPRVMDRAVGVNAIVTILGIAAFGSLFGLGGAIMAIPLAAVLQVLLNQFVFSPAAPVEEPEGRDRYSLLRYDAQQLVQDVRKQVRRKEEASETETDQIEDMIEAIATDVDSVLAQIELPEGAV